MKYELTTIPHLLVRVISLRQGLNGKDPKLVLEGEKPTEDNVHGGIVNSTSRLTRQILRNCMLSPYPMCI